MDTYLETDTASIYMSNEIYIFLLVQNTTECQKYTYLYTREQSPDWN